MKWTRRLGRDVARKLELDGSRAALPEERAVLDRFDRRVKELRRQ